MKNKTPFVNCICLGSTKFVQQVLLTPFREKVESDRSKSLATELVTSSTEPDSKIQANIY